MKVVENPAGIVHVRDTVKIEIYASDEELIEEAFFSVDGDSHKALEKAKQEALQYQHDNFFGTRYNLFKVEQFRRTTELK